MKRFILTYIILFFCFSIIGQAKYDNVWLLNGNVTRKVMRLEWNKNLSVDTSTIPVRSEITVGNPNASICDMNGNLKFYSNGCAIAGSDYKILPNGRKINPGWVHQEWCYDDSTDPYPASNNILFLPNPTDTNKYYLFHTARGDFDLIELALPFHRFLYTEIDASQGKTGEVTKKNILLVQDTLSEVGANACKHANGIDWWVIVPTIFSHSYHRALLIKDSVSYVGKQKIEDKHGYTYRDWSGQSTFSPNGKKYIRTSPQNGTYIFDFDRCTGLLSNPVFIDTLRPYYYYTGVGVSPNSRFLYLTVLDALYQFDLEADNIPKSMIKIADLDNFVNERGDRINFYKCQLAPDNKIYVGSTIVLMDWLSIIHKPNERGLACDFRQHDLKLPRVYSKGLPNMPHYRMSKLEDVDCSQNNNTPNSSIILYPNPNQGQIHIKITNKTEVSYRWELFDELGRLVFVYPITNIISNFELPYGLKNGIYFWRALDEKQQVGQGKLIIRE
jgi:hypothetical protein